MDLFYEELFQSQVFGEITEKLNAGPQKKVHIGIEGPSETQKAHYISALLKKTGRKCIYVAPNDFAAGKIYGDFMCFSNDRALYFRPKEYFLYDIEAKSREDENIRLKSLFEMALGDYDILVTSAEAIAQRLPRKDKILSGSLDISRDHECTLLGLAEIFLGMGYERYDSVQGKGQFAVRGGIIDIFPVNSEDPVRIDFFGDDIDSVRTFDVFTQRSLQEINGVRILPAREIILTEGERRAVANELREKGKDFPAALRDAERFEESGNFPGMDRYIPLILKEYHTVIDYAGDNFTLVLDEPQKIRENLEAKREEFAESCKNMLEKGLILPELSELYGGYDKFFRQAEKMDLIYLKTIGNFKEEGVTKGNTFSVPARSFSGFEGNISVFAGQIKEWHKNGYKTAVATGNEKRAERMAQLLEEQGVKPYKIKFFPGTINKSFEYPGLKLIVLSDGELFSDAVKKDGRRKKKAKGKAIDSFTDLKAGELVVHDVHGIGEYVGLEQITVNGITRDYIKIKYSDGGFLYVPTNQMDLVQKYIGSEGHKPKLSKLGSGDWGRAKKKVKESLRELAQQLVALYAKRQASKGFAFSPDTVWQKEFEESFPFEETEDQLRCTEEIKRDMESQKPMERLLCGDVGYGKTEVALRAVFKAVMDGKQVAVLVPTTVLAQQHYQTFKQRFADYPIKVDYICRFRTPAQQKEIAKNVKRGEIDVLIGTHRLIQKDVEFKDLGLLVVDEEQRFGVDHKEKLKMLKPNIDILTLSATPIPRTLHMSMVQIRDISVIEEPPKERHPVQTYVMEYDHRIIREAIYKEMSRKGQVFYLYNKVRTINVKAVELKNMVPEARIGIAHGQMGERELEQVMMDFMAGEYDILLCTTIIESGLDMPNANTVIIEDGDHLGLAQLYQIRGRVGRSGRVAFAYVTYRKNKVLTEFSEKRLQTIREFTEFGSGFKIAMRDLEIRGAGNLLGTQQHGQMESVGYDMYVKLLDRAVREIRGDITEEDEDETSVDLSVTAYISADYIPNEEERLEMYKKISLISDEEDMLDVRDEFIDRYGDVPDEVENLIYAARIKAMARKAGFSSVTETGDSVIFKFMKKTRFSPEILSKIMDKFRRRVLFNAGTEPYFMYRKNENKPEEIMKEIEEFLKALIE